MKLKVVGFIPFGEFAEAFAEGDFRGETEIALEGGGVGIGSGDITGLHGNELFVGLEVEVLGEDTCTDEFFLEDGDEVEEVFGLATTDVVDGVGWDGETVVTLLALRGTLHHTDNTLDDVVNIGEVASAVAIVVNLDGLALEEFVGETEVGHVGAACGAVDGEEAEACGGDVVELGVAMGHEFVALLRGGIEAHRVVHAVVGGEGDFLIAAING